MLKQAVSFLLVFLVIYLMPIARVAAAAQPLDSKIKLIERGDKIIEYRLPNGLQVLLVPDHSAPVATVMILYHVGSRNEAVGYTGATHMLEHIMFKGTPTFNKEKGTQIAAMLDSIGAEYNATTWYDRTNYYETLPSDKLELALQIESDRMRNSFIKDSDRQSEMTVVRNELERGENEPATVLDTQVYATAFREHPYHHPTVGWRSDVEGVPTARLKAFYDQFYWPNNATLLLIGDVDETASLALVEKYFGPIPASSSPIPPMYTVEPKQQGERRFIIHRAGELPIIQFGWHAVSGRDADSYPLTLLSSILANGVTSRLYQALVEKELAVSVTASAERLRDPGLFEVVVTLHPGVKFSDVESIVRAEIERISNSPVTAEELQRAKSIIAANYAYNNDGPANIATTLGEVVSYGDWHLYTDFISQIERVTAQQIQAAAKKYLYNDNLTIGCFDPITASADEQTGELGRRWPGPLCWRAKGERRADNADAEIKFNNSQAQPFSQRIKRIKMENGATLLTLERRATPTVAILGALLAGDYYDPKEKPYLAFLTAQMLAKGSARHSRLEVAAQLEQIGAGIGFTTDAFTTTMEGHCLSKDFEKVFSLLAEMMRQPNFPQEELEKLKAQVIAQLQQELDDTNELAYGRLTQLIFAPSHPLYKKSVAERIKSVESITIKDIQQFYKTHYGGGSLILSVVGDIDAERVARLARQHLGDWAGGNLKKIDIPETALQNEGRRELIKVKDKASADIYIGQAGHLRRDSADYYAAVLANGVLGESTLSSKLGLQVRDTEGLTYGITSHFYYSDLVDGPWAINVTVNPENIEKAINSSLNVVRQYVENGINENELARQKSFMIGNFKVHLATNAELAGQLTEMEFFNLGLDYIDRYPQLIESITKAQVDAAIRRHFHPDRVTIVIAGEVGAAQP